MTYQPQPLDTSLATILNRLERKPGPMSGNTTPLRSKT
jgi:hypothetical protein